MMTPENPNRPARIELHIEELVLHGLPTAHRFDVGDALERELQRLLSEHRLPIGPVDVASLDAGVLRVAKNARPQAIGTQLAQRVHEQLSTLQSPVQPRRQVVTTRSVSRGAGRK